MHRHCSPSVLQQLAGDSEATVRFVAAHHSLCPPEALARIAEDPDTLVRGGAASHERTPVAVLERPDTSIRRLVALNMACPCKAAKKLSQDPDGEVRKSIRLIQAHLFGRFWYKMLSRIEDRRKRSKLLRAQHAASRGGSRGGG